MHCGGVPPPTTSEKNLEKYSREELENLPQCLRHCGLIPDAWELDAAFAEIATSAEAEVPFPQNEDSDVEAEYDEDSL